MIASLALAAAAAPPPAQEPPPVFVETAGPEAPPLRDQPARVRLRVGVETGFLAGPMLQPFRRRLDLPIQVATRWDGSWVIRERAAEGADGPTLALDGAVTRADRAVEERRDGLVYLVAEIDFELLGRVAGEVPLGAAVAAYVWSEESRTDVFGSAVPGERREAEAAAPPRFVAVRDWPLEPPVSFRGAVGALRFAVEPDPDATAGSALALRLRIEGEGNWERWSPPDFDALAEWRCAGSRLARAPGALTVHAEFLPRGEGAAEFPALEYAFLDPGPPAAYRILRSEPLATPAHAPAAHTGGGERPEPPPPPREGRDAEAPLPPAWIVLPAAAAFLLGFGLGIRRRPGVAPRPAADTRRGAEGASPSAAAEDWETRLAERLGCPVPALHDPGLAARLRERGAAGAPAEEIAELAGRIFAERYGGPPAGDARARLESLLASLAARPGADPPS